MCPQKELAQQGIPVVSLNDVKICSQSNYKKESPSELNLKWEYKPEDSEESLCKYQFTTQNYTNMKHILQVKEVSNAQVWIMRASNSYKDDELFQKWELNDVNFDKSRDWRY